MNAHTTRIECGDTDVEYDPDGIFPSLRLTDVGYNPRNVTIAIKDLAAVIAALQAAQAAFAEQTGDA